MSTLNTQKVGQIGEETTCRFLKKHGFKIVERNYLRKWGELDVIAQKDKVLHFMEVKSVSVKNGIDNSSYDRHRPEDNIHPWKLKRLGRAVQTYLMENNLEESEWSFDVVTVYLNFEKGTAKIRLTEDLVL